MDKLRYFLESRFADSHTVRGFHYFLIGISGIPVFGFRFGVPGIGIQNSELPTPPLLLFCRNASTDHSKATMRTKKWEKYESQESRAVMDCPRMGGRGALYCILWLIYSRFNKKTFLRRPGMGTLPDMCCYVPIMAICAFWYQHIYQAKHYQCI